MKLRRSVLTGALTAITLWGVCTPASGFRLTSEGTMNIDTSSYLSPFRAENETCFKCHGQKIFEYTNNVLGRQVKALMNPARILNREQFYRASHRSFKCVDCHSSEYKKFPHSGELRMEQMYNCLDCHGGDPKFAEYRFEELDSEYRESVHFKLEERGFTCWKCHDPHTYRISMRNRSEIGETILYDNDICLNCHADFDLLQLFSDRGNSDLMKKHDFLPHQKLHFRNVRCIECHTEIKGEAPVPHRIVGKEKAVKKCVECHSVNTLLMTSLYKFETEDKVYAGFLNGVIMKQSYVIGANRNRILNSLSFIIMGLVIVLTVVHIILRIMKKL